MSPLLAIGREPLFTPSQFSRMSNIFDNAGNVFLAVAVLAPIVAGVDKNNWYVVTLGIVASIGFWLTSLYFARKGEL